LPEAVAVAVEGTAATVVAGRDIAVDAAVAEDCMKVAIELVEGCIEGWNLAVGAVAGTLGFVVGT
jgi:hypothetical protein